MKGNKKIMEMTLRWYGSKFDTVTLQQIRQIPGVTGVITTLYDTTPGEVWSRERIRCLLYTSLFACQSGHPGGSLSCTEMLMSLYYEVMNIDPKNPQKEDRDRFVLSKGHACPTLYAILADLGYFPKEDLAGLRQIDSHLQGHPDCNKKMCIRDRYTKVSVMIPLRLK